MGEKKLNQREERSNLSGKKWEAIKKKYRVGIQQFSEFKLEIKGWGGKIRWGEKEREERGKTERGEEKNIRA